MKPHILLTMIFCLPGNLNFALLKAYLASAKLLSLHCTDSKTGPYVHPHTSAMRLPKRATHVGLEPINSTAHESILLMCRIRKGWILTQRWKASFPAYFAMHLLQAIQAASRALMDTFSHSLSPSRRSVHWKGTCPHPPLHSHIIDSDLGFRNTAAVPWFKVGLILDLSEAAGMSLTHYQTHKDWQKKCKYWGSMPICLTLHASGQ